MVALKTERRVYLWRATTHPSPAEAPAVITMTQVLQVLNTAFAGKRAFAFVDDKGKVVPSATGAENCIFIADMTFSDDKRFCRLLINRGDLEIAHPSFINPAALTVKNVPPGSGEVQGWSAHMVISTIADATGKHRIVFERMQNVSSTLVQRYLDAILDQATDGIDTYTYDKTTKVKGKIVVEKRQYKLRLHLSKVPSEDLISNLKQGSLTAIKLIKSHPEYNGPGDPTVISSVKETLRIGTKKLNQSTAGHYISQVIGWGKSNDYDEVQFTVSDLPGNSSANPRFAIEKADAMDTLYSRTYRLTNFSKLLETCYQKADSEIINKMTAELSNEGLWK